MKEHHMKKDRKFDQNDLLSDSQRGICLRASYKWTSCMLRRVDFKYEGINLERTYAKQMEYLTEADLARLGHESTYEKWVAGAHALDEKYLGKWGAKHGGVICTPRLVNSITDVLDATGGDHHLIYGFYGVHTDTGKYWGHAVAYSNTAHGPRFFDVNEGEYSFDRGENVANTINEYCQSDYTTRVKVIRHRYVYLLALP
jgi:hypothetical protein